ncbi:MAG: c-type cytochrome [Isosphaeraceae bacterium]|nr:c-type cytochrome [Isosphaeraceae bacterium]
MTGGTEESFLPGEVQNQGRGMGPAVVALGMLALVVAGTFAFLALRKGVGPPPKEIAGDPMLVSGREIYLARCVSCHGAAGKGDGPIARSLQGPAPRDLTAAHWKHGDRLEDVLGVVTQGTKDTAMAGWGSTLGPEGTRSVTAYVYHLAGRSVPAALREP